MATKLRLSHHDQSMLDGEHGEGPRVAMSILVRMAQIQGATALIDISRVHVGGSIYTGPGSLAVIEKFAEYGAKVAVPTTVNAISVDKQRWRSHHVDKDFAQKAIRLAEQFERLGAKPTFSCTPYVFSDAPQHGEDIVWAESNAITYANSVLGARTNRHGDFLDICAAITGRAPYTGLHKSENRRGNFLITLTPPVRTDVSFYTTFGYLIGKHAGSLVPVVNGLKRMPSIEELKAFCAAVATSGAVGLVHLVGLTPEAPTLEEALGGKTPIQTLHVTEEMLVQTAHELTTGTGNPQLDIVVLGSPHFTLGDFQELAQLTAGRKAHRNVDIFITTSRFVLEQAIAKGWAQEVQRFGARISTDTCLCMLSPATLPREAETVMTNSGKFAHYGPGLTRRDVWYSSLLDCVESAESGRPIIHSPQWFSP